MNAQPYPSEPFETAQHHELSQVYPDDPWLNELYLDPQQTPSTPCHRLSTVPIYARLKARQIAEDRLMRLSEELSQLADALRYFNPVVAEILDDAWDATEEAIELLAE
ncbi:hypothetical protein [Egbenema bharatensis]|uniref:hypothetical protein n=1 Tax=Egbenema bharatensis TaxID=3463334 RepID=UPI003A87AA72